MMKTKAQDGNQLIINLEDVRTLAIDGGKLMYTPDAETAILGLLALKETVDRYIEEIKGKIAAAGRKLDPNFKGVVGEQVKSIYRSYGEKYQWDGEAETPKEMLREIITVKPDSVAVEAYVKANGSMPVGIYERERTPILSLTRIEYEKPTKAIK